MMRNAIRLIGSAALGLACALAGAQNQVTWSAEVLPKDARAGESAQIVLTGTIENTWHLYSIVEAEGGPAPTVISLRDTSWLSANGEVVEPQPIRVMDRNFGVEVGYFDKTVSFGIPVRIADDATGTVSATVDVQWMACTDQTCTPILENEVPVTFTVGEGETRPDRTEPVREAPDQPAQVPPAKTDTGGTPESDFDKNFRQASESGIVQFLVFCFSMGLLALLTPCVFPMVPITVSFFAKKGEEGKSNLGGAVAYCLGIIGTFTGVGLLMTALFGAAGIQRLANNPLVNLGLALLFVVLALNLFGVFELRLPASLTSKAASNSRAAGLVGPILMGFTFTLTTFTCTVPLVGTLLVSAASGNWMYPAIGMLAFSLAFALPFFLLALFPSLLTKLPKSGAWMASVKVFLGFVELLAAVKFLSNVDLFYDLGAIPREVFLAIWAGIMGVTAIWLMGWLRLPSETAYKVGWFRRLVGVASIGCTIWFLGGVSGNSLGELNGFLPPDPYPGREAKAGAVPWMHDYEEALVAAKAANKPVFINFTGANCTNCRWMEANMFPDPDVLKVLKDDYVPLELWTDRLNEQDKANQELQLEKTGVITLPIYVVLSPEGEVLKIFSGDTRNKEIFLSFLTNARDSYSGLARK